jgi:hypothetical protein
MHPGGRIGEIIAEVESHVAGTLAVAAVAVLTLSLG